MRGRAGLGPALNFRGEGIKMEPTKEFLPMEKREHIHVAVPTVGNSMTVNLQNFFQALNTINSNPFPYYMTYEVVNDKCPVEFARNELSKTVLRSPTVSRLWFIDADMVPPKNCWSLLGVDADLVCGQAYNFCHVTKDGEAERMKLCAFDYNPKRFSFEPITPDIGSTVIDVDACGAACLVVRRKVLEDPRMHLSSEYVGLDGNVGTIAYEPDFAPALFRTIYKPNGQRLRGEDLDFSWRAKKLGYSVKIDLRVRFGHHKTVDLDQVLSFTSRIISEVAKDEATIREIRSGQQEAGRAKESRMATQ